MYGANGHVSYEHSMPTSIRVDLGMKAYQKPAILDLPEFPM